MFDDSKVRKYSYDVCKKLDQARIVAYQGNIAELENRLRELAEYACATGVKQADITTDIAYLRGYGYRCEIVASLVHARQCADDGELEAMILATGIAQKRIKHLEDDFTRQTLMKTSEKDAVQLYYVLVSYEVLLMVQRTPFTLFSLLPSKIQESHLRNIHRAVSEVLHQYKKEIVRILSDGYKTASLIHLIQADKYTQSGEQSKAAKELQSAEVCEIQSRHFEQLYSSRVNESIPHSEKLEEKVEKSKSSKKHTKSSRVDEIRDAIDRGLSSVAEIAQHVGLREATVKNYAYTNKIKLPRKKRGRRPTSIK